MSIWSDKMLKVNILAGGHVWLLIALLLASVGVSCIVMIFKNKKDDDLEEIEELENLTKEEKEVDEKVNKNQLNLASMLEQMQKDLEAEPEDIITHFEQDQEEQSIISYQELVNTLKEGKKEVIEEPIKEENKGIVKTKKGEVTKVEIPVIDLEEEQKEVKKTKEKTKFKKTDIISPIFGKIEKPSNEERKKIAKEHIEELLEEENKDYKQVLEATMDLSPLKEEIKRNDEFLASLKEFRRNL